MRAEVPPGESFHIVRDDAAAGGTTWPKPDERDFLDPLCPERENQQPFEHALDSAIHRPVGKANLFPSFQIDLLQVLSYRYRQKRTHQVVGIPCGTVLRVTAVVRI